MSVPANCFIRAPFWVQVLSERTLPFASMSSRGAAAGSQVMPHVCVLNAWEIQGRDALNASVNVQAGDQSTTFSRFMPTAMWPVSVAMRCRGSQHSKPSAEWPRRAPV